jgi:hypothetical protein
MVLAQGQWLAVKRVAEQSCEQNTSTIRSEPKVDNKIFRYRDSNPGILRERQVC